MGTIKTTKNIGLAFLAKRKELGYTQVQAAALMGTGDRFIRELEKGKPTLQIEKVLYACSMMGINFHLEISPTPPAAQSQSEAANEDLFIE
jgi:HTH-type transcriptional regulator / antitoxin HipB